MQEEFLNFEILAKILKEYGIPCLYVNQQPYDISAYKTKGIMIIYKEKFVLVTLNRETENGTNALIVEAWKKLEKNSSFSTIELTIHETDSELFVIDMLTRALYRTYVRIDRYLNGE